MNTTFIHRLAFGAAMAWFPFPAEAGPSPTGVPKEYPFKNCIVSDERLGQHAKVLKVTYAGTDLYLCCSDCLEEFNKDPKKFVKMVKDAAAKK